MNAPTESSGRLSALGTTTTALVAAALLARLGHGSPPINDFVAFETFVELHGALAGAISVFRILALIVACYVAVIGVLALIASMGSPTGSLRRMVRAATVPPLRHLMPGLLSTGLVVFPGALLPPTTSSSSTGTPHPPTTAVAAAPIREHLGADTLVRLPPEPSTTENTGPTGGGGTATLSFVGPDHDAAMTTSPENTGSPLSSAGTTQFTAAPSSQGSEHAGSSLPLAEPAHAVAPPTTSSTRSKRDGVGGPDTAVSAGRSTHTSASTLPTTSNQGAATWTVTPGDHLWHIASATMDKALQHAASDAQISPYWQRLIEANRSRLIDPTNPDLILPGQVLVLPAVQAPSGQ